MAIDIIVIRDEGDQDGGVIQEPLLSTLSAAIERGAKELNDATDTETVDITTAHNPALTIGKLVAVDDYNYGKVWVGRIVEVNHGQSGLEPETLIAVRRKAWQTY